MAEYIEREALRKAVKEKTFTKYDWSEEIDFDDFEKVLDGLPAVDVAPVRHGRWDDSGRFTFPGGSTAVRCSECGCALTVSEYRLNKWNYCPVCGARMDGGADNAEE